MLINIVLTVLTAPIVLILGNWLALAPYSLTLAMVPKNKSKSSEHLMRYLSRITMGGTVGLLFGVMEYFGAINSVLLAVFVVFLFFLSEPKRVVSTKHTIGLIAVRLISFLIAKTIIWLILL